MSVIALLASFVIDTAGSPLVIENCAVREEQVTWGSITTDCDITNNGEASVAFIFFDAEAKDSGRSVPWSQKKGQPVRVSGGIEPGETLRHWMPFPDAPDRASRETLVLRAWGFRAVDVDDNQIPAAD